MDAHTVACQRSGLTNCTCATPPAGAGEAVAWTLVASALREYANDIEHEGPVYALGRFAPKSLRQWADDCEAQEGHAVTAAAPTPLPEAVRESDS